MSLISAVVLVIKKMSDNKDVLPVQTTVIHIDFGAPKITGVDDKIDYTADSDGGDTDNKDD